MADPAEYNNCILVADDAQIARDIVRIFLENEGYLVIEASDGDEAIRKYADYNPILVILDIIMPNIDGIAALRGIKRINPAAKVLICTATDDYRVINIAIKDGASGYIIKPYNGFGLMDKVRDILTDDLKGNVMGPDIR